MVEEEGERRGILCLKSIRVYGTTSSNYSGCQPALNSRLYSRELDHVEFVDHIVSETDTLQGLSIKYDVTMEEIKRYNQLWSNDSSCVRQKHSIKIPVRHSNSKPSNSLNSSSNSESELEAASERSACEETTINTETPEDFFSRIDASISKLKATRHSGETDMKKHRRNSATKISGSVAETSLSSLGQLPSYQNS